MDSRIGCRGRSGVLAMMLGCAGCAGLDFGDEGLAYFEPVPYVFVSVTRECVATATPVSLPGERRHVRFDRGYGSSSLSVGLTNGMITSAGQTTDAKAPELITAFASLAAVNAMRGTPAPATKECEPTAILYPLVGGIPDVDNPTVFPVKPK